MVQIANDRGLTYNADGSINVLQDGSKYIPKAGDRVRCDDSYIYNAIGRESGAWRDGKPLMTIAPENEPWTKTSWPWRASDLEELVHSRPNSHYYVEVWDYYHNGIFQYTRYCVDSL